MKLVRFFAVALAASALSAFGCSSSDSSPVVVKDSGTTDTKVSDSNTSDTAKADTATADHCADGTDCASCGTKADCYGCEDTANAAGSAAYDAAIGQLTTCAACTTGGPCYTQCNADPICSGGNTASSACITCLNGLAQTDACVQKFVTACQKSSDCVAYANATQTDCKQTK
jgi:hypothetical protein